MRFFAYTNYKAANASHEQYMHPTSNTLSTIVPVLVN